MLTAIFMLKTFADHILNMSCLVLEHSYSKQTLKIPGCALMFRIASPVASDKGLRRVIYSLPVLKVAEFSAGLGALRPRGLRRPERSVVNQYTQGAG